MAEILTLEEISDIDTFTLQQKIEELQQHPFTKFYEQLIAIARVELNERYKVQQFGRMLINDQIPILPEIGWKKQKEIINKKQTNKSQRKIQFAQCLKRSLITDQKQLVIGKPVMGNYRYVQPDSISFNKQNKFKKTSQKKFQSLQSKKNVIGKSQKLPKLSINYQTNQKNVKTISKNQNIKLIKQNKKSQQPVQKSISTNIISQTAPIANLNNGKSIQNITIDVKNIIQQPKHIIKPIIKYIQNDVYDGQKLILDRPHKLAQLCIQIQNTATQQRQDQFIQNIYVQKQKQMINIKQQMQEVKPLQIKQQIEKQILNKIDNQQKHEQNINKTNQNYNSCVKYQINKYIEQINQQIKHEYIEQDNQIRKTISYDQLSQNKESTTTNNSKTITLSPLRKNQLVTLNIDKKVKSYSHTSALGSKSSRVFSYDKNIIQSNQKQKSTQAITIPVAKLQQYQTQLNTKTKIQNKTMVSFNKINKIGTGDLLKQKPIQIIQKPLPIPTFPYHQIIPSFAKLFPHSGNLINDLRSIQKQLSDHLTKQINKLSLTDQYLRIRQNQLLFKVVSQTQKANKYKHIFDINLDSFVNRSQIMISRIKNPNKQQPQNKNMLLYRVVRQKQDVYDIINNTFHRTQNWYQLPHGMDLKMSWNLLWTWSKPQIDIKQLFYFQKVNHFFGNKQIARKDLLKKNIQRIKKLGIKTKQAFDIIPQTYFLPGQNIQFVKKFREYSFKPGLNYWIMKPIGLSRGRGIELITKIQQIVFSQPVVIQKYLQNPFLLNGYKFDMRIYVLVTSYNPLQAYVYKQGFARISTQKYTLQDQNIHNKFIHLTNFSVQKQNLQPQKKPKQITALSTLQKQLGGCKITLKTLKQKLKKNNIKWQQIQSQIDSIILKSLISTMNVIQQNNNCFQLFGYDIIIDNQLKCWLIQVNSSPSLQKDFIIDQIVKQQLVDDIVQIVDPIAYDRGRLLEVVTRRRKQFEGLKSHINTQNNSINQLNNDLNYILHGKHLRRYGESVSNKNFRRIAPGQVYQSLIKTVQQYKLTSITKQDQI